MLWDMHVHLDFMQNPRDIAREAETLGLGMFAVTVTPQGYQHLLPAVEAAANIQLGVGLHPWWVADGRAGLEEASLTAELIQNTRFVGEIGLDASPKHVSEGSIPIQAKAFEIICAACAGSSKTETPKVLSLHSVKAASLTLDILEKTGCLEKCRCIFHWFTGSGNELNRAIKAGCMFSINEMMLKTRRGREYARQIPADRLLLETDLPPGQNVPFSASEISASLERTLSEINDIRRMDLRQKITENAKKLVSN